MSVSGTISRMRGQQETKNTYNPDLEFTQGALASELYGPNARIGSYGMSGGQYPTAGKDPAGYGSGGYGYPGQYKTSPNTTNPSGTPGGGPYPGGGSEANWGGAGQVGRYATMGSDPLSTILGAAGVSPLGSKVKYSGPGNTGEAGPGGAALRYPGQPGQPDQGGGDQTTAPGLRYYGDPYAGGSSGARQIFGNVGFSSYQDLLSNPYGDYSKMLANPGYDTGTAQAMRTSSDAAARSPFERARFDLARRAALTGDTSSVGAGRAGLAAAEGQTAAEAARGTDINIANEAQRQRELALGVGNLNKQYATSGIAGMYGQEGGLLANLLSQRGNLASLLQRRYGQQAQTSGSVTGSYTG